MVMCAIYSFNEKNGNARKKGQNDEIVFRGFARSSTTTTTILIIVEKRPKKSIIICHIFKPYSFSFNEK